MRIVNIGVGAFGFAILNHLGKNNTSKEFFAYEQNKETLNYLKKYKRHPLFFNDTTLGNNIIFLDNLEEINTFDLIILTIPTKFLYDFIKENRKRFKKGVCFLNLSKGIDNNIKKPTSKIIENILGNFSYNYSVLSGGMIAKDFISSKKIGADIGILNDTFGDYLKNIFENKNTLINIKKNIVNIELNGSFKNIIALYIGYLEGKKENMSSISYYFCELYREYPYLLELFGGNRDYDFGDFSLGGDLITTCFGDSRNRYFGKLIGEGYSFIEAEEIFKKENKIAEGYYTINGIGDIIKKEKNLRFFSLVVDIFTK